MLGYVYILSALNCKLLLVYCHRPLQFRPSILAARRCITSNVKRLAQAKAKGKPGPSGLLSLAVYRQASIDSILVVWTSNIAIARPSMFSP